MNCDVVFDSIIDNFDSAIFIIDKEFNLTRCNNYFLKIINGEKKDLNNKKINDILPFYQELNKNNRLKLVFQTGKKNISEEKLNVNSQSIYSKISLIPIVDKNEIEYVMIIIENISKIVQLSNKVKRSDEFIENVLNTLRVYSIILTDKKGNITRINKGAEILYDLFSSEDLAKLNIKELFPEESMEKYNEILNSLNVVNLIRREITMKNIRENKFVADLTISRMTDSNNNTTGYLYMASDISEQIKLKQSIEKQNLELVRLYNDMQKASKAKSVFLANMSHELRTPLTAILGFTELILDKKVGPLTETQEEFLKDILSSGKHLLELINDILDLSKIEADRMEVNIQKVIIQETIIAAKTFIIPLSRKKNITLEDKIQEDNLVYVSADDSRLKQILYNLYSNAVKFTPENGVISTELTTDDDFAYVSIKDSGIGIKPEDQKLIFEEFIQIENPFSKKYAGTGLGLALVKKFLLMMNGDISVYSEGEGKGTKFTFKIPLYK